LRDVLVPPVTPGAPIIAVPSPRRVNDRLDVLRRRPADLAAAGSPGRTWSGGQVLLCAVLCTSMAPRRVDDRCGVRDRLERVPSLRPHVFSRRGRVRASRGLPHRAQLPFTNCRETGRPDRARLSAAAREFEELASKELVTVIPGLHPDHRSTSLVFVGRASASRGSDQFTGMLCTRSPFHRVKGADPSMTNAELVLRVPVRLLFSACRLSAGRHRARWSWPVASRRRRLPA